MCVKVTGVELEKKQKIQEKNRACYVVLYTYWLCYGSTMQVTREDNRLVNKKICKITLFFVACFTNERFYGRGAAH